jgi:molybdopterin/thiamine biosynthesis adenylyltransferase
MELNSMVTRPSNSRQSVRCKAKYLVPNYEGEDAVVDRQQRIPGFDQQALGEATILLIGAGGINSEIGEGIVRKGIGTVVVCDPDIVSLSNLNRQEYYDADLYKNKALSLAKNLAKEGSAGTVIQGYAITIQELLMRRKDLSCDIAVCGVDNNDTRVFVARHFGRKGVPVVFIGIDGIAEHGYVFVQEVGGACFCCLFPHALEQDSRKQCVKAGAVKDILKVTAGLALYAIDSLLMSRPRNWNYREIHLAGFVPDSGSFVQKRGGCALCQEIAMGDEHG